MYIITQHYQAENSITGGKLYHSKMYNLTQLPLLGDAFFCDLNISPRGYVPQNQNFSKTKKFLWKNFLEFVRGEPFAVQRTVGRAKAEGVEADLMLEEAGVPQKMFGHVLPLLFSQVKKKESQCLTAVS